VKSRSASISRPSTLTASPKSRVRASRVNARRCGLHVIEDLFIVEIIDPAGLDPAHRARRENSFLPRLRKGFPLIRYRTGDIPLLSMNSAHAAGRSADFRISGRTDDLISSAASRCSVGNRALLLSVPGVTPHYQICLPRGRRNHGAPVRCPAARWNDRLKDLEQIRNAITVKLEGTRHPVKVLLAGTQKPFPGAPEKSGGLLTKGRSNKELENQFRKNGVSSSRNCLYVNNMQYGSTYGGEV